MRELKLSSAAAVRRLAIRDGALGRLAARACFGFDCVPLGIVSSKEASLEVGYARCPTRITHSGKGSKKRRTASCGSGPRCPPGKTTTREIPATTTILNAPGVNGVPGGQVFGS